MFQALDYLDEWDKSSETFRKSFEDCGFDDGRWMRSVQRTGVLMYGMNHPMQIGMSQLAVQIAEKVLPNSHVVVEDLHTFTTDYLSRIVWPVYPEIGDHLGVEGSRLWREYERRDKPISKPAQFSAGYGNVYTVRQATQL